MISRVARNLSRTVASVVLFAYIVSLLALPAQAQHVISVLGTAPLLGDIQSTSDLQQRVVEHRAMFETASADLGLTSIETTELIRRIMAGDVRWVRVPRHLDEMTWAWDGSVYMYRDVVIPAFTYGWEIDLQVGSTVHALFIPAKCGNLSLVERQIQVSYAPPPPSRPQAPPQCPRGMMGAPPSCYVPQCPQGMMGTPPNCYTPQCPQGMTGTPPNCYEPCPQVNAQGPNGAQYGPPPSYQGQSYQQQYYQPGCGAPEALVPQVIVKTEVRNEVPWWIVPLSFVGVFFGGHFHVNVNNYPPPPPPPIKCLPPP